MSNQNVLTVAKKSKTTDHEPERDIIFDPVMRREKLEHLMKTLTDLRREG